MIYYHLMLSNISNQRDCMAIEVKTGKNGTYLNLYPNSSYDPTEYERPTVAVDTCICTLIDNTLKVLLIKRKIAPYKGKWAIPGGYVNIKDMEDIDDASLRELKEETGATGIKVRQLHTYGKPKRDPRWRNLTVAYFALVPYSVIQKQLIEANDDASDYGWYSFDQLPTMAFDHETILNDLKNRLVETINYSPIGFELVDKNFTWTALQTAYESILGRKLLAPNFRRAIKRMYDIKETSIKGKSVFGRTPNLFTLNGIKDNF